MATAQDAPTVQAATPDQVAQFLANPASILAGNPSQADLAATIQSLALANSDTNQTLAAIISLSQSLNAQASNSSKHPRSNRGNPAEMAAIGTGLANAATSVQTSNPTWQPTPSNRPLLHPAFRPPWPRIARGRVAPRRPRQAVAGGWRRGPTRTGAAAHRWGIGRWYRVAGSGSG